jgi:hypothetical protein
MNSPSTTLPPQLMEQARRRAHALREQAFDDAARWLLQQLRRLSLPQGR